MKSKRIAPKETETYRNEQGELVTVELNDGLAFDVVASVVLPPAKRPKRGPDTRTRHRAIRRAVWELISEGKTPITPTDLAKALLEKHPSLSYGNDHRSLEKVISKILEAHPLTR